MQFLAIIAAVFATSALAARGGNDEGPYRDYCVCVDGQRHYDSKLSKRACDNLQDTYETLHWTGHECEDNARNGLEYHGYRRACQDVDGYKKVDAYCYDK